MTTPIITQKLLCNIVQEFLGLSSDQVWIMNQKRDIPTDSRLYVVVSLRSSVPIGTPKRHVVGGEDSLTVLHAYHAQETLQIDMISASQEATSRVPEVIMALSSDYALNLQELHGFKLATQPSSVNDTSAAEVTRNLFRTTIEVKCLRCYQTTKSVAYYEQFENELHTEGGIIE